MKRTVSQHSRCTADWQSAEALISRPFPEDLSRLPAGCTLARFCLALALALGLSAFAFAQSQTYGDITITLEAMHPVVRYSEGDGGYAEFRATITNNSPTKAHRVEVEMLSYTGESGQARRSVELAPNSTVVVSLFALPQSRISGYAYVNIDGERQNPPVEVSQTKIGAVSGHDKEGFELLLSPGIFKSGLMNSHNLEQALRNSAGEMTAGSQAYEFPMAEWSANWMSYARYGGVVVYGDEWKAAPEAVRTALLRYVERGGSLLVSGEWQPPAGWQARRDVVTDRELSPEELKAAGVDVTAATASPSATKAPRPQTDLPIFYLGFGTVTATGAVDPSQVGANQWRRLGIIFKSSRPAVDQYESLVEMNKAFQVVESFGVPVRGLFALMLVFVIIIGPVNLIWLARRKRKIWMLWTVPLIALLTCMAIASFSLFGEGWSATTRTESLTLLDETAHRATTIGWTAFYSPITPSDGLHFSYDTELDPQFQYDWAGRRGATGNTVDWTRDQHLASGWVLARVPAFFKLRKSETRRERLSVRQEAGGAATLVNGLGAEISEVWWADAGGRIHSATNIPAGAQSTLKPTEMKAAGQPSSLREAFNQSWLSQFRRFTDYPQTVLMPNSYLAVVDGSSFVEEGLKNVKTRKARSLVYGISLQYRER